MRRLAAALGVEAMSLYHYVPSKAVLVDRLNTLVLSRIDQDHDGLSPTEVVAVFAQRLFEQYRQHPDLARTLRGPALEDPALLQGMEVVLAALASLGLDPAAQVSVFRGLVALSLGFAIASAVELDDLGGRDRPPRSGPETPTVTALAPHFEQASVDADFTYVVAAILRDAERASSAPRP
jgi:AcrR family transcriptional regulator